MISFKNRHLLGIKFAHHDLSIITLFTSITFFETILPRNQDYVCFYSLNNKFACFRIK